MPLKRRILHVVGARPNFMKAAPLVKCVAQNGDLFEQTIVHTGQHYDAAMSDVFFSELKMPQPDVNLEVGSGSHARQTAEIMVRFEPVLLEYKPDCVVVFGDVNSTVACALVAAKLGFPIAHVEAGLRSFDRTMPEEINRVMTDHLCDLLFTPSADGDAHLLSEGIPARRIHRVGNIMIDALVEMLPQAETRWSDLREKWPIGDGFILVTLHRPSNVDHAETLSQILQALDSLAGNSRRVLFPVHPRTRMRIQESGYSGNGAGNLIFTEPLGYLDFLALEKHADLVLTDSGGIQEETTFLGVPCLTARPNTERPVTIDYGTNALVASRTEDILRAAAAKLAVRKEAHCPPEMWDGKTAGRIVSVLREFALQELAC